MDVDVDARTFIRRHALLAPAPFVPEISLFQADDMLDLWQRVVDREAGRPPPYWAFAWAGGQAVARLLLDHPDLVAAKTVLDLGAGSGLCAIAAARAGAIHVRAVDVDPYCGEAVALNAEANGVVVEFALADLLGEPAPDVDVILAGDVCYEEPFADRALAWLAEAYRRGVTVLIGDPSRSHFPHHLMVRMAGYDVPAPRTLEGAAIMPTGVYTFAQPLSKA